LFPTIIQSGCYSPPHLFNGYHSWGEGGVVQWLGCEVHHSLLSSAELKNEWSYMYSPVCLDAMDRENFYHTPAEVVFVASPLRANLCFFSQNVCMLYACCHRLLILSHMNLLTASCVKIFQVNNTSLHQ